jgi:membrane fusion protein, copper/silver efflux system
MKKSMWIIIILILAAVVFVVKSKQTVTAPAPEKKIMFYRNPMNPEVTSPVPMKDSMGMDYVPVYSGGEKEKTNEPGVYINPEKQQLIGIKQAVVDKRRLIDRINTVGNVAYDTDLYVAQQEYLEILKLNQADSNLLAASERKLYLLGMSQEQIKQLAEQGKPQENLYLPGNGDRVWIYLSIHEYQIGLVHQGQGINVKTAAAPGETFQGKISAISPVLDPNTRAVQVRAEVSNPGHRLKPQMFVDVSIDIDLGVRLAVPVTAVVYTGERNVVYVAGQEGYFTAREIKVGAKTENYYEILSGLTEGEKVVSAGNFFVDSESNLKAATP